MSFVRLGFALFSMIAWSDVNASTEPASFFYAICLNTHANLDRIFSMAQVANWRKLPDSVLDTFIPERRPQRYSGWLVPDMGAFVLVVQGVDENRRNYRGCSVFFRDALPTQVIGELLRRYRVNNPIRENDGFQRYVYFGINVSGINHQIMISYLDDGNQRGTLKINTLVFN